MRQALIVVLSLASCVHDDLVAKAERIEARKAAERAERVREAEERREARNRRLDAEYEQVKRDEEQRRLAAVELKRVLDAVKGFHGADWGMSEAEVAKLFPGGRREVDGPKRGISVDMRVANLDARVYLSLDAKAGLTSVVVSFADEQLGYATSGQVFDALGKSLVEKYGYPRASNGLLEMHRQWAGAQTLILLRHQEHPIPPARPVMLLYTDRRFYEAEHSVQGDDL